MDALALWTRFGCVPGGNCERDWQAASFGQIRPAAPGLRGSTAAHACRFTWTIAQLVEKSNKCAMPHLFQLGHDTCFVLPFKDNIRSLRGLPRLAGQQCLNMLWLSGRLQCAKQDNNTHLNRLPRNCRSEVFHFQFRVVCLLLFLPVLIVAIQHSLLVP
jgi:hypothetical protein